MAIYEWMALDEDAKLRFARAREAGFDIIAQEALAIADSPLQGEETEETDDGKLKTKRGDMLGHRKLQVETRLKLLAKWFPQEYGDKLDLNHGGQVNNPVANFFGYGLHNATCFGISPRCWVDRVIQSVL